MVLVYELGLHRDSWHEFLSHNGFGESNPPQVDKPVVAERKSTPVPYDVLLPRPKPELPTSFPKSIPKQAEATKSTTRKTRTKTRVDTRGKKNARLISRMVRNKPKLPAKTEPITISEDSDSDIERFLSEEYPYSKGLCSKPPHDFVRNLPPCLRNNPDFPGIEPLHETLGESSRPPSVQPVVVPCDQCGLWIERCYLDVPTLQSKIHELENQVATLTGKDARVWPSDKKQRTMGSVLFKNIESATAIINSKLA
jgi:hypothetical protein